MEPRIDVFGKGRVLMRMVKVLGETVPARFLARQEMRDEHAADEQALPELKNL